MNAKKSDRDTRLPGLRRFAVAITLLNVVGHAWLGFEQSVAQPLVALATAYALELLLEVVDAKLARRPLQFMGGPGQFRDFLLSAHISAMACAMLLYANEQLWVVAFAAAVAIGSKSLFRIAVRGRSRHIFNPSNFGITATLLLFPWVGVAMPYQFTENLSGAGDWILPAILVLAGSTLNTLFTRRIPLILAWVSAFAVQAIVRSILFDLPLVAGLVPMSGVAFLLFTFYMITDPATSPISVRGQILFGISVAAFYSVLVSLHIVFGLFFALTTVCLLRGAGLAILEAYARYRPDGATQSAAAVREQGAMMGVDA